MAKIVAQRRDCTGKGWDTFVEGDGTPFFNYGAAPMSQEELDAAIEQRAADKAAAQAEADRRTEIEERIRIEMEGEG